jgi:hypothetical protein
MYIAEPTVMPPVLLDLCTVSILHRFSSPSWWKHLTLHVSADVSDQRAFDKVVRLKVSVASFTVPPSYLPSHAHLVFRRQAKQSCSRPLDSAYSKKLLATATRGSSISLAEDIS